MRTDEIDRQSSRRVGRCLSVCFAAAALLAIAACAVTTPAPETQAPQEPPPRAWSADALGQLRAVAESTPLHGLGAETQAIAELDRLDAASRHDAGAATALDLTADAVFRRLALVFSSGAVDPASADPSWTIPGAPAPDVEALLNAARAEGHVATALTALLPSSAEYAALESELAKVGAEPAGTTDASGLTREDRLERLRANLERLRWLPRTLPARRIDVLVPFFEARPVGFGSVGNRRVIVGVQRMPTPTFQAEIESITLNPSWTPPNSIVSAELLPRFRRNPAAAAAEGFEALDASGQAVDPALIDWRARPFPYVLRQRPGAHNALGRVRFDMPNSFAIYLHDTPARNLFERSDRRLSHGCIRLDDPVGLASEVLANSQWSKDALQGEIDTGATQTIRLDAPLPIYILYLTAAADGDGVVRYANDVYGRDRALLQQLEHASARPLAAMDRGPIRCAG